LTVDSSALADHLSQRQRSLHVSTIRRGTRFRAAQSKWLRAFNSPPPSASLGPFGWARWANSR